MTRSTGFRVCALLMVFAAAICTVTWATRGALASSGNPHNVVVITRGARSTGKITITISGPSPLGASYQVDLTSGDVGSVQMKALLIRNRINRGDGGSNPPYQATATASNPPDDPLDTVTVTARNGGAPAWNVKIGGNDTQEGRAFRKNVSEADAIGTVLWSGGIGGGTVSVGVDSYVTELNTGAYQTVEELRSAVVADLNAHGVSASVEGDEIHVEVGVGEEHFYTDCDDPDIEEGLCGFSE